MALKLQNSHNIISLRIKNISPNIFYLLFILLIFLIFTVAEKNSDVSSLASLQRNYHPWYGVKCPITTRRYLRFYRFSFDETSTGGDIWRVYLSTYSHDFETMNFKVLVPAFHTETFKDNVGLESGSLRAENP